MVMCIIAGTTGWGVRGSSAIQKDIRYPDATGGARAFLLRIRALTRSSSSKSSPRHAPTDAVEIANFSVCLDRGEKVLRIHSGHQMVDAASSHQHSPPPGRHGGRAQRRRRKWLETGSSARPGSHCPMCAALRRKRCIKKQSPSTSGRLAHQASFDNGRWARTFWWACQPEARDQLTIRAPTVPGGKFGRPLAVRLMT